MKRITTILISTLVILVACNKEEKTPIPGIVNFEAELRYEFYDSPAEFHEASLIDADGITVFSGTTDADGKFSAPNIPNDGPLTLSVLDYCGVEVHTEEIGPFLSATASVNVAMVLADGTNFRVTGYLKDCDGSPITSNTGFVLMKLQSGAHTKMPFTNSDGYFDVQHVSFCDLPLEISIFGVDEAEDERTTSFQVDPTGLTELGDIYTCTSSQDYLDAEIAGTNSHLSPGFYYERGNNSEQHLLQALSTNGHVNLLLSTPLTSIGQYDAIFTAAGVGVDELIDHNAVVHITADDGQYLSGYTSGVGRIPNVNTEHNYSVSFKVERVPL